MKMQKRRLLCFAADMEVLPINYSFHSASLWRTKDNQIFRSGVYFKLFKPQQTLNLQSCVVSELKKKKLNYDFVA